MFSVNTSGDWVVTSIQMEKYFSQPLLLLFRSQLAILFNLN